MDGKYHIYLAPYKNDDGETGYEAGIAADIDEWEKKRIDDGTREYAGEFRAIDVEKDGPDDDDWEMLVSGVYTDTPLRSFGDAMKAYDFVKAHRDYGKAAYASSPPRTGSPLYRATE